MPQYYRNQDISFKPFSRAAEHALFVRYKEHNDIEARDAIISNYLKFAAAEGLREARGMLEEDEAISAANYGLMRAIENFDHKRGTAFCAFARQFIRGRIKFALSDLLQSKRLINLDMALRCQEEIGEMGKEGKGNPLELALSIPASQEEDNLTQVRWNKVRSLVPKLPIRQQRVVLGILFDLKSGPEVARELGITPSGVRLSLKRAITQLKRWCAPHK